MSRLFDEMRAMEAGKNTDAILFYPDTTDGIDGLHQVLGVVRHLPCEDGDRWAFHTTLHLTDTLVVGFGVYGDLETVAKAALYQFGNKLDTYRWDCLTYSDPLFPTSLVPKGYDHERARSLSTVGWDHRSPFESPCSAIAV